MQIIEEPAREGTNVELFATQQESRSRPALHRHPRTSAGEPRFSCNGSKRWSTGPQSADPRNIIRAAIPGAPKRQKVLSGHLSAVMSSVGNCQVAFAMEKASVVDLSGPLKRGRAGRVARTIPPTVHARAARGRKLNPSAQCKLA